MSHKKLFSFLIVSILIGLTIFWYYRETIFSKEILKLEILGEDNAKIGEEITYTVKYKNNGNFVLENPKIVFELPDNSLTEDNKLRFSNEVKDIYPGQEESLQFKGRLLGKEGDVKVAHVSLSYNPHNLSARYESTTTFSTKIESVPITLTYDSLTKIEKGKELRYSLNYFSNVDYPLENLSIKIDPIKGFAITSSDPASLDHTEWKLKTLMKGQGGRIKISGTATTDAESQLHFVSKIGMWQNGTFVVIKEASQDIEAIQTAKLELTQKAYYSTQKELENSGPIPPQVGQSTNYAVRWQVKNYFKDIKNVKVKAILPQNVSLEDAISPEDQAPHFSYDSGSREIVWLIGDLSSDASAEIIFQIALVPNPSQRGRLADLVGQATVFGEDQSLNTVIQSTASAVTSNLPNDLTNTGNGIVQ